MTHTESDTSQEQDLEGERILKVTFEELRLTGNLPSPSGVGMRILTLTQAEDYSTQEIAAAIQADPALTGRLLKLANSAQSGSREPIVTVGEATMRLGVRAVRNVALGLSLVSNNRGGQCNGFDYDLYWADSLARAVAAQRIASIRSFGVPAEAYVCGLLSRVGCLAFASVYPEEYADIHASAGDEVERLQLERRAFAINHAEIGAYMLEDWGLPATYGQAILELGERAERYAPGEEAKPIASMADLLRGAALIAEVCLHADDDPEQERFREPLQTLRRCLELEQPAFEQALRAIVAEWRAWGGILTIPTQGGHGLMQVAQALAAVPTESAARHEGEDGAAAVKALELAPGVGLRILAVDDDAIQLKIVGRYLENLGAEVSLANDGRQALQIALASTPQLVLADWMMPGIDGIKLCRALRKIKQGREMHFILLTGREGEERIVEAFDAGVDDYVVKPFNPKLLLARIKAGKRLVELEMERARDRARLVKQATDISRLNRRFQAFALTDLLTELRNRRYAMERLQQEWSTCQRTDKPLSVVMLDIDFFKRVNDTWGHAVGDQVLKETARILRQEIRVGDDAIRLGGEEFLIACYGTRDDQALICAERVRAAVEANCIVHAGDDVRVTVSLGIAQRTPDMAGVDDLLKAADRAVYDAKHGGRNRVCIYRPIGAARESA